MEKRKTAQEVRAAVERCATEIMQARKATDLARDNIRRLECDIENELLRLERARKALGELTEIIMKGEYLVERD